MALSLPLKTQDDLFDYIDEPEHIDTIYRLIEEAGLKMDTFDEIAPIQDLVAAGKLQAKDIPARLMEKLRMDEVAATAFAKTYTQELLYPMKDLVPSVAEAVALWKVVPPEASKKETQPANHPVQRVSANKFVHEELEKYNLELPDGTQQKKFEQILSEFVAGKRNRESALQSLIRPRKVGGLGLDKLASKKLLEGLSEDASHVPPQPMVEEKVVSPSVPTRSEETTQSSSKVKIASPRRGGERKPNRVASKQSSDSSGDEDHVVVAPREQQVPKPKPLPPRTVVKPLPSAPKPPVQEDVTAPKSTFEATMLHPDDDQEIEAHKEKIPQIELLHDLESVTQQVMKAISAAKDLPEENKKKLHAIVKTRLKGIRDAYKTRAALESQEAGLGWSGSDLTQALEVIEKTFSDLEAQGQKRAAEEKKAHVEKRTARFRGKDASAQVPSVSAPAASTDSVLAGSPPSTKAQRRTKPTSAPQLPSQDTSLPKQKPLKRKGKVRDVVAPRKLAGPLEELGSMTIADFRRLGAEAQDASDEVTEKIHLLEEESYARRLEGIAAWRRSPLYETYVSVVSEAMRDGKPIEQVLAAHRGAGEEMFTTDEVRALIVLNGTLRV